MAKSKKIRIGFDLDGVLINKPPLVPKKLIEYLYRGEIDHKLKYRFPQSKFEIFLRVASHYPIFRRPIKKNIALLKQLARNGNVEIYSVSGRFSFLKKRTNQWMDYYSTAGLFKKIYINDSDMQPHLFKARMIKKLDLDYFVDDDELVLNFLKKLRFRTKLVRADKLISDFENLRKLSVLIGISYYFPNISGLTVYAQNLAMSLVNQGYEVNIITSKFRNDLKAMELVGGVNVHRSWTPFLLGRGPIMPMFPIDAFKHIYYSDVVNIHIPQFEGFVIALMAKLLDKKVVITHHCDLSGWEGVLNRVTEAATYASLYLTCLLADKIVVYTKDYADHSPFLQKFKYKLFYQLPPVKLFPVQKDKKLAKAIGGRNIKIGFAGRIGREKGIDVLFNVIPLLKQMLNKNFKIYIAGPDKEVIGGGDKRLLEPLISKFKGNIVFLGALNQGQMTYFYEQLDVLVLPSVEKLESFGFVQVEAMFSGCPVVASNLPGVRMPIKLSNMGEIAKVGDSVDLANKLYKVITNKKKYIRTVEELKQVFNFVDTIDFYQKLF